MKYSNKIKSKKRDDGMNHEHHNIAANGGRM